jgi:L-lactate utilization protein LutB
VKFTFDFFCRHSSEVFAEMGYEPHLCETEEEARNSVDNLIAQKKWPCLFSGSDTTGEKKVLRSLY